MNSPLTLFGIIGVTGAGARRFLQAQFTNDIEQLTATHAQLNAWCSPSGRVRHVFWLFDTSEEILILAPKDDVPAFIEQLRLFVLRAKVKLTDRSDDFVVQGFADIATPKTLQEHRELVIQMPTPSPRLLHLSTHEAQRATQPSNSSELTSLNNNEWRTQELLAGIPYITPQTREKYIPQMLNLDHLEAVSFTKGCYCGQEIIARTQHLGQTKRRLFVLTGAAQPPVNNISHIDKIINERNEPIGDVFAAQTFSDTLTVQAILSTETTDNTSCYLETGHELRIN